MPEACMILLQSVRSIQQLQSGAHKSCRRFAGLSVHNIPLPHFSEAYMKLNQNHSLGQSILEILVALTIMLLVLTGVLVIEVYALKNSSYAADKSRASALANQQLERIRVLKDIGKLSEIADCQLPCYINPELTPMHVTPTGKFSQSFLIQNTSGNECPLPEATITPVPTVYRMTSTVDWSQGAHLTPPWRINVAGCITD